MHFIAEATRLSTFTLLYISTFTLLIHPPIPSDPYQDVRSSYQRRCGTDHLKVPGIHESPSWTKVSTAYLIPDTTHA